MPGIARLARIAFNYSARTICLRELDQKLSANDLTGNAIKDNARFWESCSTIRTPAESS